MVSFFKVILRLRDYISLAIFILLYSITMNMDNFKDEFHKNYKPKIHAFLAPFTPLWRAIVTFCKTSLGMVILVIIIISLLIKMIGWYYHHKYMRKHYNSWYYYSRDIEPRRWFDDRRWGDMRMIDHHDDIFSRTERYFENQRRMMQDRIDQVINSKPDKVIRLNTDGTGVQQSISRISSLNGENQWYTLTVNNNTINWSIIWAVSDSIRQGLQNNNITLDNNNFSAPYSPELWDTLTILLKS